MNEYQDILDKFKYDPTILSKDILNNLWQETRELMSDLEYIKEHFYRTAKGKYGIEIIPTLGSVIMNGFFREMFRYLNDWGYMYKEQYVYDYLAIYKITYILMNKIQDQEMKDDDFTKLEEWRKVVKYYTSIDIKNRIHCFCGCNYGVDKIENAWNEYSKRVCGWVF
jgi:hypothetical protein